MAASARPSHDLSLKGSDRVHQSEQENARSRGACRWPSASRSLPNWCLPPELRMPSRSRFQMRTGCSSPAGTTSASRCPARTHSPTRSHGAIKRCNRRARKAWLVRLTTALDRPTLAEGDTAHLRVKVDNASGKGQGMAVAIVGLPAGAEIAGTTSPNSRIWPGRKTMAKKPEGSGHSRSAVANWFFNWRDSCRTPRSIWIWT